MEYDDKYNRFVFLIFFVEKKMTNYKINIDLISKKLDKYCKRESTIFDQYCINQQIPLGYEFFAVWILYHKPLKNLEFTVNMDNKWKLLILKKLNGSVTQLNFHLEKTKNNLHRQILVCSIQIKLLHKCSFYKLFKHLRRFDDKIGGFFDGASNLAQKLDPTGMNYIVSNINFENIVNSIRDNLRKHDIEIMSSVEMMVSNNRFCLLLPTKLKCYNNVKNLHENKQDIRALRRKLNNININIGKMKCVDIKFTPNNNDPTNFIFMCEIYDIKPHYDMSKLLL